MCVRIPGCWLSDHVPRRHRCCFCAAHDPSPDPRVRALALALVLALVRVRNLKRGRSMILALVLAHRHPHYETLPDEHPTTYVDGGDCAC